MSITADRRKEQRANPTIRFTPVSCTLVSNFEKIPLEIVNYHYRGACFKVSKGDYRVLDKGNYLQFRIGLKELSERIIYRVVWETIAENGCLGVEFSTESAFSLSRAERFLVHNINAPTISSQDPLDPNRIIYLKVVNASTTGMLVTTSLSNKHLFPGMELRAAILAIPGIGKADVDLFIENSRPGEDNTILLGVSLKGSAHNYHSLMAKYLSNLGSTSNPEERLDKLKDSDFLHKELRGHLTIREVQSEKDYNAVLKLRFMGYKLAGKVDPNKTWQDMGDGLKNEGIILGAYLAGQIVASCEFRVNSLHGLRLSEKFKVDQIPGIRSSNLAEINKLVVHPNAQNSDVVLGIFQKIHSIAMLNGRPDGIIAAEPKLVTLYERLGFKKNGFTFAHPIREDIQLNIMTIYNEAYSSAEGMNPYAWSIAFEETQKFFDEIGVNKSQSFSVKKSTSKLFYSTILKLKRKRKKTVPRPENPEQTNEAVSSKSVVDPKWTKQHLNATVLLPYVLEAIDMIGEEQVRKILFFYGLDVPYFKTVANWVSIDFFDDFIDKFSEFGDPYLLNKKTGYRSVTREILGANYFIVKHFFSPTIAFKAFEKFLPKFNKTRIYKVVESGSTFCRIKITTPDPTLFPKHPSAKENWYALAEAYVLALTGKPATIRPIKSEFDGDDYCEFVVSWKNKLIKPTNVIGSLFATLLAYISFSTLTKNYTLNEIGIGVVSIAIIGTGIVSLIRSQIFKRKYTDLIESMEAFEKQADEKYRELQTSKTIMEKSYQEGKILESINKEIQNSHELSNILQISLESLCANFEFKRAFVMIKDDSSKYLRTASVFGAGNFLKDLWDFKVDIDTKRENPLVLSSAFHSGQSILVNDVESHLFHLNEPSRRLVKSLNTNGFAIVPLPSDGSNWGVLIADKGNGSEIITRRDLVALQRIAQSLGLALDKQAKIETEVRARKIFQKYVPSMVIEKVLGEKDGKLGGTQKEAICLFMDIRNFTNLSTHVPPEILCDLLNQVFSMLQKNVSKTNGIIDKFLGDGALVTWGAIPGTEADPIQVIQTIQCLQAELHILNEKLISKGMNPIDIGIGMHRGPVIAGNIGSDERMEFTVIGNTVNIASRLEQLTKVYKCNLVVSEQLVDFDRLPEGWSVHSEVQVRGLDKTIRIATFKWVDSASSSQESA